MRALSLDKPSTMGRFLLTSIEDAHKRVDCMPCHELRLKPFIYRMQRKGLRRETNRRTVTSVSDVAAPRCAPGFHINRRVTRITLYTPQTVQCAVDDRSRLESRRSGLRARLPHPRARGSAPRDAISVTSLGYASK